MRLKKLPHKLNDKVILARMLVVLALAAKILRACIRIRLSCNNRERIYTQIYATCTNSMSNLNLTKRAEGASREFWSFYDVGSWRRPICMYKEGRDN